ncbi:hypothetical protein GYA49_05505 [Candidatus Beckwithbacteria bacterium]|nr:hypothetical protein [Candidatus Beckwithbacteria bacterium]
MNILHKKPKSDILHSHYFILCLGLAGGAGFYFLCMGQLALQVAIIIGTGLFYILWGTLHHAHEGDFHPKIVLEYTLVASLAMALLLTLILRT